MNLKDMIPAAAAAAPAAPALLFTVATILPPVLAGFAIAGFVCWVIDESKKQQATEPTAPEIPAPRPQLAAPNVMRGAANLPRSNICRIATCQSAPRSVTLSAQTCRVMDLPAPAFAAPSLGYSNAPVAGPVPTSAAAIEVAAQSPAESAAPTTPAGASGVALFARKLTADKVAAVFAWGPLSRKAAVAALLANGASRSRAYEALRDDGAFMGRLVALPDGSLSWKA